MMYVTRNRLVILINRSLISLFPKRKLLLCYFAFEKLEIWTVGSQFTVQTQNVWDIGPMNPIQ